MGTVHLVESPSSRVRLKAAGSFLQEFAPATEVLLVGASRGAIDDLAREVAAESGATFGLHRFSLTQLASRLGAPVLAAAGLSPSTSLGAEAVAARATFDASRDKRLSYFAPVAATPGFARALARTLMELRQAGVAGSSLRNLSGAGPDIAELLERFGEQFKLASSADRASLFAAAVQGLDGPGGVLARLPVLLLDVPLESPAEIALVRRLAETSPTVLATVPEGDELTTSALLALGARRSTPDDQSDNGAFRGDVSGARGVALARLSQFLFVRMRPPAGELDDQVRFFSAPGEGRESIEIARRILQEAEAGLRFDRMAILLRSPQTYVGLLEHALERARIPAYFDHGTKRPDPSGRAFLALLACAGEGLSAKGFAEYLSLGQVPGLTSEGAPPETKPIFTASKDEALGQLDLLGELDRAIAASEPEGQPRRPAPISAGPALETDARDSHDVPVIAGSLRTPWKWERLLVEAAVVGGRDRWIRRLDGLAREYHVKLDEIRADEPESSRARGIERDLSSLSHLRRFAIPVITLLAEWPSAAVWGDWLSRFEALAPRVLRRPVRVLEVLADLRPMAEIGPVTLDEARQVLTERLAGVQDEPPKRRYGRVFVGTPQQARGRVFEVVFVPGLAERVFPKKQREDPMLLDHLRERLDERLQTQVDRDRKERLLLRIAVGAATRRVYLSFPRLEVSESRPRVPSFYALDVFRAITGQVPNFEQLERQAEEEGGASLAWPAPLERAHAIDAFEHDLATLKPMLGTANPREFKGHAHYLLRLNPCLRRSVIQQWCRWKPQWSPADGLLNTPSAREALGPQRLDRRPYSLSALQRYAVCPYQFLLAAIYRLEVREEPEPIERMDPLTRGSLFHAVQAEFFRALSAAGRLPVTRDNLTIALATLEETMDRVAAQYHELLAPAIERVWRDEVDSLRSDLRVWVRKTTEEQGGWEPWRFEYAFGLPGDTGRDPDSIPDPVTLAGRFRLRGSIDLVERKMGTTSVRVTDHKTGRVRTKAGLVIGGGTALQPVLYSLAVEAATGLTAVEGRLFYCTSAGQFESRSILLDDHARRLGLEALEVIDRGIDEGRVVRAPQAGACQWCDFRPVCGPNEERRVGKKIKSLADLQELRSRP